MLPLLDCSRMEVTVFIIHEQQRYQLLQVENHHLVGEVQVKMYIYGVACIYMRRAPEELKAS